MSSERSGAVALAVCVWLAASPGAARAQAEDRAAWARWLDVGAWLERLGVEAGQGGEPAAGPLMCELPPAPVSGAAAEPPPATEASPAPELAPTPELAPAPELAPPPELAAADLAPAPMLAPIGDLDQLMTASSSSSQAALVKRLRGSIASELRSYPLERAGAGRDERLLFSTEIELDINVGDDTTLNFRPRFLIDLLETDFTRLEPYAGYLQYTTDRFDLRAGQFIDNWGIADTFNPIDVLNRRDWAVDAISPPRLGEIGLRARVQLPGVGALGQPTVSLYLMPVWRETLLPRADDRYSFSQAPFVLRDDPETPELEDALFAAVRVHHTLDLGPLRGDVQYIGARGPARFPAFSPMPRPDGSVVLATRYFGAVVVGGGFRLVPDLSWLSDVTLKTEVVYTRPYAFETGMGAPDRYLQLVAGFDHVFYGVLSELDTITLTAEYLGEELADDLLSRFRPFEHDVAGRVYWQANDFARTSVELRGITDVVTGELIGEAAVARQLRFLHDDLGLELRVQGIAADEGGDGFFAFFPNNSNVRVRLGFDF